MTCTVSENPYDAAEGMREEERELMRQMVDLAKQRATQEASQKGYGENRTKIYVQQEMLEARNKAHDRFLLEQIKKGLVDKGHAVFHGLTVG